MWLAGPEHRPSNALVQRSDSAGTRQPVRANIHGEIRIGADQRQAPRQGLLQQPPIMLCRFSALIDEATAQHGVSLADAAAFSRHALEQGTVARLGSDAVHPRISGFR